MRSNLKVLATIVGTGMLLLCFTAALASDTEQSVVAQKDVSKEKAKKDEKKNPDKKVEPAAKKKEEASKVAAAKDKPGESFDDDAFSTLEDIFRMTSALSAPAPAPKEEEEKVEWREVDD